MFSHLELAQSEEDDGILEVHEIFNLELDASLIALSACNTALGSGYLQVLPHGDDLVCITQAFLYAGTPSVIASLWEISDYSTALFMNSFYKNLKQMYFAKNPYEEVSQFLKRKRYVEVTCAEDIPLQEAIYALILMRRHIWLFSELQGLVSTTAIDMYQMVESINRVVLLFDYAIYTVAQQYQERFGQS